MDEDGFEFVNSIPKPRAGPGAGRARSSCLRPADAGSAVSRVLSQVAYMGSGYREGGFFIVIGRRRA